MVFPFLLWFRKYSLSDLKSDAIAGVTVALVLIPQSMAYAQLAGLPAYYGLYASFLPPMVGALFGSSRRLATGPVAVVSMMTAASLEPLAIAGSESFIAYAILLAFVVGLFQFLLGVLRLGVIVNLLSHPVVSGFTNAAALIIASSQLSKFFGVHIDKAEHYYETLWRVGEAALNHHHWSSFFMGVLALAIMIGIKKWNPRLPYILVAVVLTTVLSWLIGFEENRVVSVTDINVPDISDVINEFNTTIEDTLQARSVQATITRNSMNAHTSGENFNLCSRCHAEHRVNLKQLQESQNIQPADRIPLEKVLELHVMAGVLDRYLAAEKQHNSSLREKLRAHRLVSVQAPGGGIHYVEKGSVALEQQAEKNTWYLRVGKKFLDTEHLVLVGGGEVVGAIPGGIPALSIPRFDLSVLPKLLVAAVIISILGFMEAISIAKTIAASSGGRIDPNQELIGQGLANMVGSFGGSYPVSGSFSRSAVNYQAGARSGMASVVTSLSVIVVLLLFTPLLYHLPQAVLAAIIMMAVIGLLNVKDIKHAFMVKKSDGVISVITFVATLFFAPHLDKGILLGVSLSVGMFFYNRMKPVIAELSCWKDGHYRDARHFNLKQCEHIAIIRFDGPLFFANISYLEDEVLKIVDSMPALKIVHFKSNGINDIDSSGDRALMLLVDRLHAAGFDVYFSGLKEHILDTMRHTGLLEKIGENHLFATLEMAIDDFWGDVHSIKEVVTCPLKKVMVEGKA